MDSIDTTSTGSLSQRMCRYIESQVPRIRDEQQSDGSFGKLRMLNDQYAFAPLALLYVMPESEHHQSAELLEVIQRGMDGLLDSLDDQGRVEFFGHDGFSHGWHYYEWVTFYWQESLVRLRGHVDEAWWQKHADQLQRTLAGHEQKLQKGWDNRGRALKRDEDVANLFVWNAVLLYRAGQLWDRPAWRDFGQQVVQAAVAAQQPEGWWFESGPVNTYSLVTAQAVSVYYELSGDNEALEAVARSLRYHTTFSYPDGTFIETIDGRQPYHPRIAMMLPPTFSRFPQGAAFLQRAIDRLPETMHNLQGISMMTSTLAHLHDEPTEPDLPGLEPEAPCQVVEGIHAAVLRPHDFCICACGYESVPHVSNWRLDRQSLLSVWHAKAGLIVGGGNSKYQPAFSSFNVNDRRGQVHYLHHQPRIEADASHLRLAMRYGQTPVSIEVNALAADRVQLVFRCDDLQSPRDERWHVTAQLPLIGFLGESLRGKHAQQTLDERALYWTAEEHGGEIAHHGWTLRLPEDCRVNVQWPVRRFNPYRPDRKSALEAASLLVSMPLVPDAPTATCELLID